MKLADIRVTLKLKTWKLVSTLFFGIVLSILVGYLIQISKKSKQDFNELSSEIVTNLLLDELRPQNIKENLKVLTKNVHPAGTGAEEEILVDFISGKWKSQLDDVEIHEYDVLLSYPNETQPNYVAMVNSEGEEYEKTPLKEPSLTQDETFTDVGNYFIAYSVAGHVVGKLVYVNFGRTSDFDTLKKLNIHIGGNICIARYGKIFRGDKARHAELAGCIGLIIFTDPQDYGNKKNLSAGYPDTWWMPSSGIQSGSLYIEDGDPLTVKYPAFDYMYRHPESETPFPKIPVQPISFEMAFKYLSKIGGTRAPHDWQGGLNIDYNLGGEFLPEYENDSISIFSGNYRSIRTVRNVIGYIWGSEEPDRYVILGNHRDAWVYGAIDPSSGTAIMMEVARVMGFVAKSTTWRPKRTLVFCSWAAEEYGLLGSTEWVKNYEKKLMHNAVVYFNVDVAVQGGATFNAKATPNLKNVLHEVTKKIKNPNETEIKLGRPTVYDTWKLIYPDKNEPTVPFVHALDSGSDYSGFLQMIGISCIDLQYTYDEVNSHLSSYPIYHSAHETVEYFEKFLDPEYKISVAVGHVWTELARQFSDDVVFAFDCFEYAISLEQLADTVVADNKLELIKQNISFEGLLKAVKQFKTACKNFNMTVDLNNKLAIRQLNNKLMYLDRQFIDFNGLPGRTYYRHVIFAPSNTDSYSSSGFPGIVDTIYDAKISGDWEPVKSQLAVVQFMIETASYLFKTGMPANL